VFPVGKSQSGKYSTAMHWLEFLPVMNGRGKLNKKPFQVIVICECALCCAVMAMNIVTRPVYQISLVILVTSIVHSCYI